MKDYVAQAEQIASRGWAVVENFLSEEIIKALADEAGAFFLAGQFKAAGVGRNDGFQVNANIRSDHILWLDEANTTAAQAAYFAELHTLRQALNQELFTGLQEVEAHFALYPPGSFYERHLDQFNDASERLLSCSLYLNSNWSEDDGGELRIYTNGDSTAEFVSITPRAGVFALFRSDTIWHEVRPARKERYSVTGWFRRRPLDVARDVARFGKSRR